MALSLEHLLDTMLQIEGLDGMIRNYPIHFDQIDIENIETQQRIMNKILRDLMSLDNKDPKEIINVFEQVLGLVNIVDEFPGQFYTLLSKTEFLKYIVPHCTTNHLRVGQLCFCVLTKILEYCTDKKIAFNYINSLLLVYNFEKKSNKVLHAYLDKCEESDVDYDRYSNATTVILNFLVSLFKLTQRTKCHKMSNKMANSLLEVVARCLKVCMAEEDSVEFSLELVHLFLDQSRQACQKFVHENWYRLLFDVISNYSFEEKIVQSAASVIVTIYHQCIPIPNENHIPCSDEQDLASKASVGYFVSESLVYVIEKFNFYEEYPTFILIILEIFEKITKYRYIAELLVEQSAIVLIINSMRCHYKESRFQISAIKTLENLNAADDQGNMVFTDNQQLQLGIRTDDGLLYKQLQQISKDNTDSRWLSEIFAAMINHRENIKVQEAACLALSNRVVANPDLTRFIGEGEDHLLPLHMTVLAALNIHRGNIYVFRAACEAISAMSIHSKELQQYLYTKGASASIIKEMKANQGEVEVHGWGCRALRCLALNNPYQEELMFFEDILSVIYENVKTFSQVNVLKECIGLLVCLATDLQIVLRQCMTMKVPELILRIADENLESEELVETALEAIALFTSSEEQQLLHINCIRIIRKILDRYIDNASIQLKGCVITQLINADLHFIAKRHVLCEISGILKHALSKHYDNTQIQIEGCISIYLMFIHEGEQANVLKKNVLEFDFHNVLFKIIEDGNSEDDAVFYAKDSLERWASEQSFKDELLQKACEGDYNKCAEFLIGLGASLEARPQLPLCIAVTKRNIKLVEILLSHETSNAAEALALCLEMKNYDIAGVLLRYIGYEENSGNLMWGNLNIKNLKPELIFNTLTFQVEDWNRSSLHRLNSADKVGCRKVSKPVSLNKLQDHDDDIFTTPSKSLSQSHLPLDSDRDIVMREPSSSESSLEDIPSKFGRKIKSLSGPILPFNQDDPRLSRKGSDAEKHFIPIIPIDNDYTHYPRQPDASPITGDSAGILLSPRERCVTPDLFGPCRRPQLKASTSENSISTIIVEGRMTRSITYNNLDSPQSKIMKPNSPRTRTKSCITPPKIKTKSNSSIKTLDISLNQLTDINSFLTYPSTLLTDLLHQLRNLHLNGNLLIEFSKECCEALPGLKVLNLANNKISCFPYEILQYQVLETLDLSQNCISNVNVKFVPDTLSLQKLDLSCNKLSEFPTWIGVSFPRLMKLSLRGNQIREIPNQSLGLRSIKDINLSHNIISRVSSSFFKSCISLEKIDLSHNILETLPNYAPSTLSRLNQIKLSHNRLEDKKPFYIPQFILAIPSLIMVDLSSNRIGQLPEPKLWGSRGLKELCLADNRIRKMTLSTNSKLFWPCISRLNLSHNKIETLPPEIGVLDSLVSLDISHNPISYFPDEIGLLKKVFELPLDGLKLKHDPAALKGRPQDVITYFGSKLKNAVPYRRMKLMIVGLAGRGKSSLLRKLANLKHPTHNLATVGIELKDWELKPPRSKSKSPTFVMNTWDFAGQEDFYSTHQYFLSSRALYLAVYDASRGRSELENLRTWLLNIQASAPGAMVVLVGTHSDKINKEDKEGTERLFNDINEFVQEPGFPIIQSKFIVNCLKETNAMESLREEIYSIISDFRYEGNKIIEQAVPRCYVDLEDLIRNEAGRMMAENILPIKKLDQLFKLSQENNLVMNKEELACALKFLKETGSIMHFSDPTGFTNNLYFIDPQWLCQMMARVVTIREINPYVTSQGILSKQDATKLFPRDMYPPEFVDRYFRLLLMFEIVLPLSEEAYLVAARVQQNPPQFIPKLQKSLWMNENVVTRRYKYPYIPNGFWARIITRVLLYEQENLLTQIEPQREFWQNGIYIRWNDNRYFLIATVPELQNTFDIYVPENQDGFKLLGVVVSLVDNLSEEWYPGLIDTSYVNRSCKVRRLAPCVSCRDINFCHFFTLEECFVASLKSDMVECPNCGPCFIKSVAPDCVFADIDTSLIVESLNVDVTSFKTNEMKIGAGAFASVYKVAVEGDNLAAKVFTENGGIGSNRLLRQEVDILIKLHHPCLISFFGVSLRPRMLLLEFAPLGNLEDTLKSGRGPLSRGMQHRIGLQIVEGLTYLHDHGIVYRDLKPGNVLVFSLSMGMFINVKLSDYGISQWSSMMGLTARKGTPGYQAPEVNQANVRYDEKIDIVSFGVTFYEIITGGHHPYGDTPFQSQMDVMVLSNKPMISICRHGCPPWTDIENLIQQCLHANPEHRPKAIDIRNALLNANVVCLKREVAISRDQSVECTTIRRFTENNQDKLEVWVGSGETEQSQISWFTLGVIKRQNVQGMIVKEGRIMCMESYQNYIIVGTSKGYILIFNAEEKVKENKIEVKDAVLSMKVVSSKGQILLGLASGDLLTGSISKLISGDHDLLAVSLTPEIPPGPIACLTITGNRLLCGYGLYVLELRLDNFKKCCMWKAGTNSHNNVSVIVVGKAHTFVVCRGDHQIRAYDRGKLLVNPQTINCYELLRHTNDDLLPIDCRPISMALVDRSVFWIGCENGQIIIIDVAKFPTVKTLDVISRNNSAIRSIAVTPRLDGTSASVITSGIGFKSWSGTGLYKNEEDATDGYVLVWDAELPKQKKHMLTEHRKREEMAAEMECNG